MAESAQDMLFSDDNDLFFADEDDNDLSFTDEETATEEPLPGSWKVMIVDDEACIHIITMLSLADFAFIDKPLVFVSAYSGREARELIQTHPDTAMILLDVVMETDDAGLAVVRHI